MLDLHKGTMCRSGNKNIFSEDDQGWEHDPILCPSSQRRSPHGFPGLLGNDEKHEPHSDLACNFWIERVANCKALDTFSSGTRKVSDASAPAKEPGNPTDRDTTKSPRINSRVRLHRSRIWSFLESSSTPAPSSGVDHLVPPVPGSSTTVFDAIPNRENEVLCPSLQNSTGTLALDAGARDRSLELIAQKRHSGSACISSSPTNFPSGKDYDLLIGADAMSLHARRAGSVIMSRRETEDELLGLLVNVKSKDTASTGPRFSNKNDQRQNLSASVDSSSMLKNNESSGADANSHLFEPWSVAPITPAKNGRIRHLKSRSADASAFYPNPPSNSTTTPTRAYKPCHGRPLDMGIGHPEPSFTSAMPNAPLGEGSLGSRRQSSVGTQSVPVELGVFKNLEGTPQPLINPHYPEPHQYTPEGQAQCFDTQGSITLPMPAHFSNSHRPNTSPFSSLIHYFDMNTKYCNAQVYEQDEQNTEYSQSHHFDSYATSQTANSAPNAADLHQNGNLYTQDTNGYGTRYYSNHTDPSNQVIPCPLRIDYEGLRRI